MILKIALLLSVLFQLGATIIAVSLIRRTRYNISWILISASLVLMAVRRFIDFSALFMAVNLFPKEEFNVWIGVVISLLLFVGVIFIRKIFNLQDRIDQLKAENESRVLSAVIQAEEKARRSFARDLHDGLGPVLSAIKMNLSAVDPDKLDQPNKAIVQRSCLATDEAIVSLKEISDNLSPHLLTNYGLIKAVETFADHLLEGTGIQFDLQPELSESRYTYELEISLYRIISELCNNSVKHASPKQIRIYIGDDEQQICLSYADDGCGFDAGKYIEGTGQPGMGLENIFSRTKSLKGRYQLDTAPGKGFSIDIMIPVLKN